MKILIYFGIVLTVLGLGGLIWCIFAALKARREDASDEDALKQKLQKLVAYNLGSLALSAFGLIVIVVGILLE